MVVQHNLQAMNSSRMLGITQGTLSKSTEKLSSGYKINRAADNAAGLAISEKMRKQIRGLTQASINAEDGISAVQTAEGALTEVHDMLQRMNELAVQAANGTNSEDDRLYIQDEIDQLTQEIDRVAETTKFNEAYLLKGDITNPEKRYTYSYQSAVAATGTATFQADAASGLGISVTMKDEASSVDQNELLKLLRSQGVTISTVTIKEGEGTSTKDVVQYNLELNGSDAKSNYKIEAVGKTGAQTGDFKILNADGKVVAEVKLSGGGTAGKSAVITATTITASAKTEDTYSYYDKDGNKISANALQDYFTTDKAGTLSIRSDARRVYDAVGNEIGLDTSHVKNTKNKTAELNLKFHVGADGTNNNKISINIDALTSKGLGINGLKVNDDDGTKATDAISTIAAAIKMVSRQRSALGAVQNRLEHTINNLDNIVENTTSAESTIRDTDMADEMVKYSNNNILAQAGQSMLAQANQSNQGVLSLLG